MSTEKTFQQLTSERIKYNKDVECLEDRYEQFRYALTESAQLVLRGQPNRNGWLHQFYRKWIRGVSPKGMKLYKTCWTDKSDNNAWQQRKTCWPRNAMWLSISMLHIKVTSCTHRLDQWQVGNVGASLLHASRTRNAISSWRNRRYYLDGTNILVSSIMTTEVICQKSLRR